MSRLIQLYTEIANVFREELYAENADESLRVFEFENIKNILHKNGKAYFDSVFEEHQLDGFLSINNY